MGLHLVLAFLGLPSLRSSRNRRGPRGREDVCHADSVVGCDRPSAIQILFNTRARAVPACKFWSNFLPLLQCAPSWPSAPNTPCCHHVYLIVRLSTALLRKRLCSPILSGNYLHHLAASQVRTWSCLVSMFGRLTSLSRLSPPR
jgi:hypothetical protein